MRYLVAKELSVGEKLDKAKLAVAKQLYMNFRPVVDIAEETGLNARSIRYHVDNYWAKERSLEKEKFFEYITENKKHQLVNITDRALTIIENSLRDMASKPVIKIQDARMVADILEKIDRILKLDEGKATSISTTAAPSTVFELRKRLSVDPFITLGNDNEEDATSSNDSSEPNAISLLNSGKQ